MTGSKASPPWRRVFLRALGRTGNVRVAAAEAGVSHGTAYAHRLRNADFAAAWARVLRPFDAGRDRRGSGQALGAPRLRSGRTSEEGAAGGTELSARTSARHGTQLVRVGVGRWSRGAEDVFLEALAGTACVRRAAAAAGFSTTAVYKRRGGDAGFAARWDAALAAAVERLDAFLVSAGLAGFDPALAADGVPQATISEAITILKMKGAGAGVNGGGVNGAGRSKAGAGLPAEPDIEAVRASILRKIEAIEAARKRGA